MTVIPTDFVREARVYQRPNDNQYPFEHMKPGWTFFTPLRTGQAIESLQSSIMACAHRAAPAQQFVTSITREKGVKGVRCWCVLTKPNVLSRKRSEKPANAKVWKLIINRCGGRYALAGQLEVGYLTVCKWAKGVAKPHPKSRNQLRELCHAKGLPDPFDLEELKVYVWDNDPRNKSKAAQAEVDIFS